MNGALRLVGSAIAGLVVTLAVFLLMTRLVQQPLVLGENSAGPSVHFFEEIERSGPPLVKRTPPPRRPPKAPAPPAQRLAMEVDIEPARLAVEPRAVSAVLADFSPRPGWSAWGAGGTLENGLVPRAMLPPMYPHRALLRGIEGEVQVGFEVGFDGQVARAWIVTAVPEEVFDNSALQAVRRWKFVPPTDEQGRPIVVTGTQTIAFTLVDELSNETAGH